MNLTHLPKIGSKGKKRVGRGLGSGKGKTAGRGTKGQNARGKLPITHTHYEGGQRPLFKRLPYRRGKGNSKISKKPLIVNLLALNILPKNSQVDLETLIKFGIVEAGDAKIYGVKILGDGRLNQPLIIKVPISNSARAKIEKAGGKVELEKPATPLVTEKKQESKIHSNSSTQKVVTRNRSKSAIKTTKITKK